MRDIVEEHNQQLAHLEAMHKINIICSPLGTYVIICFKVISIKRCLHFILISPLELAIYTVYT